MKTVLAIAAMPEEILALDKLLGDQGKKSQLYAMEIHSHQLGELELITAQSGIGKVNAACSTTLLIDKFKPDYILNTGSAGGLHQDLTIGDVVVSETVRHHDVDAVNFGYKLGQVPRMPEYYQASRELIDLIDHAEFDFNTIIGEIVAGDSFIAEDKAKDIIINNFPQALAVDMESSAIAQTCHRFNIPFAIIRSISDVANQEASVSFDEFLPTAAKNSAQMIYKTLNQISGT